MRGDPLPLRGGSRRRGGVLAGTAETVYSPADFIAGEMGGGKWVRQGDYKAMLVPTQAW